MSTAQDQQKSSGEGERRVTGTGEFQLRGIHVQVRVEVCDDVVQEVEFESRGGSLPAEVEAVRVRLQGQSLCCALAIKPSDFSLDSERGDQNAIVALLEAFHRAVEVCFDEE